MRQADFHIILGFIFLIFKISFSQNEIEFKQQEGENVSPQSITYGIAQDSIGNIWIASEEGVLKHNSKYYKTYNSYKGLPSAFSNRISEIFIDSNHRIWIGLENGVCLYDKNLDVFKEVPSDVVFTPSLVTSITEDDSGIIWVGGYNGLWRYDTQKRVFTRILSNQNIQAIYASKENIIIGTSQSLHVYHKKKKTLKEIDLKSRNSISFIGSKDDHFVVGTKTGKLYRVNSDFNFFEKISFPEGNPITDILPKDENTLYVATDGNGLFTVDNSFKVSDHFVEDVNNEFSISSNGIYDILIGKENIVWIATYGGGVNYFEANGLPFHKIRHKLNNKNSLVANFTRSIAKDSKGKIWFGTKKGVAIWNRRTDNWTHIPSFSNEDSQKGDIILALQRDGDHMWVGTYNKGIFKVNIHTLKSRNYNNLATGMTIPKKVYAIARDLKRNIWFGGIDGKLTKIDPQDNIETYPLEQIRSIIQSDAGNIIASGRYGVYCIDEHTKEYSLVEALKPDKEDLAFSTINSVAETENKNLVLGTNGEGVIIFNPVTNRIRKLGMSNGMPSDIVQGIIPVSDSVLWASTTKGLVNIRMTTEDTIINVFDKRDGLSSTEFNYGSYFKLNDTLFAFGGTDGVTLFNPSDIRDESFKPRLEFDSFKIFNKNVIPGDEPLPKHINETSSIILKHNENSIEIGFIGILHSSASKVKYQYKLEGFDKEWSQPTPINFANYTNLNPGEYVFKVVALNKFSEPGEERQIRIEILSPWWATTEAYVLYFILLIALVYTIIHFAIVIIKKKNADNQIDFFNNITHEIKTPLTILISSLDNIKDSGEAPDESRKRIKTTVKRINSLFEQMLNFQKITSADALSLDISHIDLNEHIEKRLQDFQPLTSENNLKIVVNNTWEETHFYYDKDILDKILQNLISNAIKYSFPNGTITITLEKTSSDDLKMDIVDEGLGIPKDQQKYILNKYYRARNVINSQRPGTGLGLMMVKKLLEKAGGTISFKSKENHGTTFTVVLRNLKSQYLKRVNTLKTIVDQNDLLDDNAEIEEFSDSKILIVEDNDELREVLVDTLGIYFQVFEATNGKEGLEMALQHFPDIILTDLIMPEMDGMQMARKIKGDINLNHIPVFMLTVLQNSDQKLESIEAGISEYIEKPIDIKFLIAKIINTLNWQQKLRKKYVHDSEAENASIFRNKHDQEFLQSLEDTILANIENQSFSVHDLSGEFNMSRTSLYMKLKNLVDLSPQDFIIHTKLKHAKQLLIEGEHTIKEIAYQSGFSNPKYFSTAFKKFYKVTPSGFLNSLKDH